MQLAIHEGSGYKAAIHKHYLVLCPVPVENQEAGKANSSER